MVQLTECLEVLNSECVVLSCASSRMFYCVCKCVFARLQVALFHFCTFRVELRFARLELGCHSH